MSCIHVFTWITGVKTVKTADLGYVRLYGCTNQSPSERLGLRPRLHAGPVCDVHRRMRRHVRVAALCTWTFTLQAMVRI